jgi:hypothetical protein
LTATLCAKTQLPTLLLQMPIRQTNAENTRSEEQTQQLKKKFAVHNSKNKIIKTTKIIKIIKIIK